MDAGVLVIATDLVASVLLAFGMTRVLPMRWPAMFIVLYTLTPVYMEYVADGAFHVMVVMAVFFAVCFLLPLVLYRGNRATRVVAVVVSGMLTLLYTFASSLLLAMMTGEVVPEDYGAYKVFTATHVYLHMLSVFGGILLYLVTVEYFASFLRRRTELNQVGSIWFLIAFAGLHGSLLVFAGIAQAMVDGSTVFYAVISLTGVACFAADVLVVWSMDRAVAKKREEERALFLQKELDEYLSQYASVMSEIEQTAQLRHDLRNHTQTIMELASRGLVDEARGHLSALEGRLACDSLASRE